MKQNEIIEHFRKHWMTYLLIIAVAILLYMLLSPGKPVESHRTEAEILKKSYNALQDSIAEQKKRDQLRTSVIVSQDSTIRSIRANNEITRRELDKTKAVSQKLAKEIRELQPEDTSVYAHKVNELITENQTLIEQNDQYVAAVDSLNKVVDQQKATYEQRISDQVSLNSQMRSLIDNGKAAYDGLNKDYKTLSKRLSREKVKTKVVAVVAIAAIVKGFFLK